MKHYRIDEWVDYSRNLVPGAAAAEMGRHLEGCPRCCGRLASLERVREVTAADRALAPPDGVVRSVRALFAHREARGAVARLGLVFDSALEPAAAGARSSGGERHLLYRSDEYALEVRIERPAEEPRMRLVGELARLPHEPQAHTPVHLMVGGRLEAAATTDLDGTFRFDWPRGLPLELSLWPEGGEPVGVTLDRPEPA